MQYLIFDPETHVGVGRGEHGGDEFSLAENQAECTDEQYADPTAWMLDGDQIVAAPPPAPPGKSRLTSYAAAKRYTVETGGIVVNGVKVATDDRSKTMIIGAALKADKDPAFTTSWVAADGSVHALDAAAIEAISDAVAMHVDAAFSTYATVADAIAADPPTITSLAEIDAADWPPNV